MTDVNFLVYTHKEVYKEMKGCYYSKLKTEYKHLLQQKGRKHFLHHYNKSKDKHEPNKHKDNCYISDGCWGSEFTN